MRSVEGKHLLFGPDGNRRYAQRGGTTFADAYGELPDVCGDLCGWCRERGLGVVSLWLLQEYNLARDPETANLLVDMVLRTIVRLRDDPRCQEAGVRLVSWSPEFDRVRPGTTQALCDLQNQFRPTDRPRINVILAYDQDRELAEALERCRFKGLEPNFATLAENWCVPPVDIFFRTGQPPGMANISAYWPRIERARILSTELFPQQLTRAAFDGLLDFYERAPDSLAQLAQTPGSATPGYRR